jgi:DNA-binding transcriptional ArsR family regulator
MSSMHELENLRYAEIRGKILGILAEDYISRMTSIGTLVGALDLRGYSLSEDKLTFHLTYLEDSGYVRIWRTQDMPGFRRDRMLASASPDDIRFAKLMPAGLQLIDADRPEDPKVRF